MGRVEIMTYRQAAVMKTNNRFHGPQCTDETPRCLRALHAEMDRAVLAAYEWTDLNLTTEFQPEHADEPEGQKRLRQPGATRHAVLGAAARAERGEGCGGACGILEGRGEGGRLARVGPARTGSSLQGGARREGARREALTGRMVKCARACGCAAARLRVAARCAKECGERECGTRGAPREGVRRRWGERKGGAREKGAPRSAWAGEEGVM